MGKKHIGSDFDDFLRDERLLDDAETVAAKRVIAFQIAQEMERCHLTKSELARRMRTSRPAVERLLDPANPSVTLWAHVVVPLARLAAELPRASGTATRRSP